jgi:hypothetical protein
MTQKKRVVFKCSAVLLLVLLLTGPSLTGAAAGEDVCLQGLKKCIGHAFMSSFISLYYLMTFPMSMSTCLMGYEWCILYYV